MSKFILTTETTCDLEKSFYINNGISVVEMPFTIDGVTYKDTVDLTTEEFYQKIEEGAMPTTSQPSPEEVMDVFRPNLEAGFDILHIGFSSGLSGTHQSTCIARDILLEEFPDRKIIIVDTLCASLGVGMLLYYANEMKKEGASIEEIAQWVEDNKLHVNGIFTVNDLNHLHRGGRVSKGAVVVGSILKIKPILNIGKDGKLGSTDKVTGRKKALLNIVEKSEKRAKGYENKVIFIAHSNCLEDAQFVASKIKEKFCDSEIVINSIGSAVGSHTGIGTVAIFFLGEERE